MLEFLLQCGTIGGIVASMVKRFSCIAIACLFGYCFCSVILFIGMSQVIIPNIFLHVGFTILCIVIFALFVCKNEYEEMILLLGTSLMGSMVALIGFDIFLRTGFVEVLSATMIGGLYINE